MNWTHYRTTPEEGFTIYHFIVSGYGEVYITLPTTEIVEEGKRNENT